MIRILITDDQAVVRQGLRALIQAKPDLELAGEASDGIEAVRKARELQPDVILMDLQMPRKDGIEAIADIVRANPRARILVLTSFADHDTVVRATKAGAMGYLLKNSQPKELVQAIHDVYRREPVLSPAIARRPTQEQGQPGTPTVAALLSEREIEVTRRIHQ